MDTFNVSSSRDWVALTGGQDLQGEEQKQEKEDTNLGDK